MFQNRSLQRRNMKQLTLPTSSEELLPGLPNLKVSKNEFETCELLNDKKTTLKRNFKKPLTLNIAPITNNIQQIDRANVVVEKMDGIQKFDFGGINVSNDHVVNMPPRNVTSTAPNEAQLEEFEFESKIELKDLVQLGKIGAGSSGTVMKALHVPDSKIIAKKTIPVETNNSKIVKQLVSELSIMKKVSRHPNIVEFYGAFYEPSRSNDLIILLEYLNCGSLDKILSVQKCFCKKGKASMSKPWFNEMALSKISFSVLTALSYLYEEYKIIHRDIKPSNILISSKGQVKVCDFGVSKKMINSIADTFVGTSTYMSPERIQGNVYSTKGDIWSLGLMVIELVTGEFPLGGHRNSPDGILDLLQRIVNEPSPKLPMTAECQYSREMRNFVDGCCVKDESRRSSINELLRHEFITKYHDKLHDKEFKRWCKEMKTNIKMEKQWKKEDKERAKYELRKPKNTTSSISRR